MKVKYILLVAILIIIAAFLCIGDLKTQQSPVVQAAALLQPARQGAWLDSITFSEQGDANQAVSQLQSNDLDVFVYPISDATIFQTVLEDPDLTQTEAHQLYYELTFNPYGPTSYDGRLNPFSDAKIRQALNWLIDRDKITQEIYGGLAAPLYTAILETSADFQRFNSTIEGLEATYAYNFSQAQAAIATEMEDLGATLENGKWQYNGQPVTIIFIIRIEDNRIHIGDYVADQLEKIGFTVDRQYMTRAEASPIWNLSDPGDGQWHIYTGGWVSTAITRDDGFSFGYFYTPLGSGSPLWQAYDPTPEFQALCDQLWSNNFSTLEERAAIFEQALPLAMGDSGAGTQGAGSLRVWLVYQLGFEPQRVGIKLANDLVGGINGAAMFPYVARFESTEGGNLRVAQPGLLVDPWNPIAGSTWSYDALPIRTTADTGTIADPNTGLYWPLRIESAEVAVLDSLPVTKTLDWVTLSTSPTIEVPGSAWVDWDATNQVFITAGEQYTYTVTANSRVTVHYPADLFTTVTWHDGSPLSMGDFIMNLIMQFDRAKADSLIYDESAVPSFDSFMSHFKGLVIESIDPLVITTYDDRYYLDAEGMIQTWYPMGGYYSYANASWHALTPAIRAEQAGQLAFSYDKAQQLGVEWTNYLAGPSLNIMESWMNQSAGEHYIPYLPTMGAYVDQAEADARWLALQAWYTTYHHFWLGTGPFYVQQASYDPKSLILAHFDAYPDVSGRWDAYATPPQPELVINHEAGAPGSYFNVAGTGFAPNSLAWIVLNDHILDQLQVDSSGNISFTLSTNQSALGIYHLRVSVNPSAGVQFTLSDLEPLWPREGNLPIIIVPPGLYVHLPLITKN